MEQLEQASVDPEAATVQTILKGLQTSLVGRGLTGRLGKDGWSMVVGNPRQGRLTQRVVLAHADDGTLCWYWRWGGSDNEPAEHELICPGLAVDEVTERLARVLALAGG